MTIPESNDNAIEHVWQAKGPWLLYTKEMDLHWPKNLQELVGDATVTANRNEGRSSITIEWEECTLRILLVLPEGLEEYLDDLYDYCTQAFEPAEYGDLEQIAERLRETQSIMVFGIEPDFDEEERCRTVLLELAHVNKGLLFANDSTLLNSNGRQITGAAKETFTEFRQRHSGKTIHNTMGNDVTDATN